MYTSMDYLTWATRQEYWNFVLVQKFNIFPGKISKITDTEQEKHNQGDYKSLFFWEREKLPKPALKVRNP